MGHAFIQEELGDVVLTLMRREARYQLTPPVRALWGEKTLLRGRAHSQDLDLDGRIRFSTQTSFRNARVVVTWQ